MSSDTCNVICHGDLWRNNILFNDSATPPNVILVDYQMLRYASLTLDLAMLLYVHSTPEFRKTRETSMLEHYYGTLSDTLKHNSAGISSGVNVKIPSYEKMLAEYEMRKIVGMAYAAIRWPLVLYNG